MTLDPNTIIPNLDGVQPIDVRYFEVTYLNLIARSNVIDIEVPPNSELLRGHVNVTQAWNTGTTHTLDIGDATDDDRYTGTAVDLKTAARTAIVPTGFIYGADGTLQKIRITSVPAGTAPTQGKARIELEFVRIGKASHTQG